MPDVGDVLSVNPAVSAGAPTPGVTFQWFRRDGGEVLVGTGSSYALVVLDMGFAMFVRQTASNVGGVATADSVDTALIEGAPFFTADPTVAGTAQVGETLTLTPGTTLAYPAVSANDYQWYAGPSGGPYVAIPGATGLTYEVESDYVDEVIFARHTATNSVGATEADSALTAPVVDVVDIHAFTREDDTVLTREDDTNLQRETAP